MNIYENGTSSLYNIEIQHDTAAVLLLAVNSVVPRKPRDTAVSA